MSALFLPSTGSPKDAPLGPMSPAIMTTLLWEVTIQNCS